jgi:subtilisin family serine protease
MLDTGLDPDHLDQRGLVDPATSTWFVPSTMGPPYWADDHAHGTLNGGIVTSNNFGTAGVAPNAQLVAVKVLDASGNGNFGDIIGGIVYAASVKPKIQVINMSLGALLPRSTKALVKGGPTLLSLLNRAVNYAKSQGVLVVSSAGNDALDLQHDGNLVELPCEAGVQLCVSATSNLDTRASYSNYGTDAINVAAPGGDAPPIPANLIMGPCSSHSAIPNLAVCKDGIHYTWLGGTSEAAPHVAGLAAYLDSQAGGTLTPSQLITLIEQNADDIGKPGADPYYGKGRINVFNTVTAGHP